MKHMPNSWKLEEYRLGMLIIFEIKNEDNKGIARFATDDENYEKLKPIAQLISAAPELLEACEKTLHDLRRIKAEWQIDAHESIKLLKRAINKAKEEEQK